MGNAGRGGGGFVAGFLVGALLGGAAAVLISQEETRDMLLGKAREAGNFAADATGDLRGKVNDATSQWQSSASDLYTRGKQVVENARTNFEGAVEEGKSTAKDVRDDLQSRADA